MKVFFVDDEPEMVDLIQLGLKKRGFQVIPFGSGADAIARLPEHDIDVVVTDLNMKGMTGLELCQRVVADRPDVPVIVLTAFGSFETAVGAIRAGAYDFVTKPIEIEALAIAIRRAGEHRRLRGEVKRLREVVASTRGRGDLVGASPAMQRALDLVEQVSPTDATVLITGERGTGKETVARAIHERSRQKDGPFVAVNCAAAGDSIPEAFARARGGTLFLDDIAEVPLSAQPALLEAIQAARDVRLVCATSRDLEEAVEDKRFREDLFYRINVVQIPLAPLRARGGDVLLIADHLLRKYAAVIDKKVIGISQPAAQRLLAYDWPGNVRELGNAIEHAAALTHFEELQVEDLPDKIRSARASSLSGSDHIELLTLEEVERRHVLRVLEACNGNRTDAAKMLDLDRKTLYRKLLRWGVGDDS